MATHRWPHIDAQDGVCGCPEFWKLDTTSAQVALALSAPAPSTRINHNSKPPTSSTSPSGASKETCFFWYHSQCRRGSQCQFQHELHFTWPIVPPPGYVHFESCKLMFCPLREDVVTLKRSQKMKHTGKSLGSQVDGAAMSRSATMEPQLNNSESGSDSDTDTSNGKETYYDAIDPGIGVGEASDTPSAYFDADEPIEAVVVKGDLEGANKNTIEVAIVTSPTPASDTKDYLDVSGVASPPPSSEIGDEPILSLSHRGTLRKRKWSPDLPNRQIADSNRLERERIPKDLRGFLSASNRKRQFRPFVPPRLDHPAPAISCPHSAHDLPARPTKVQDYSNFLNTPSFCPTKGPRAKQVTQKPICFYWYHQGYCRPGSRNGRRFNCTFTHTLETPLQQVSMPPNISNHGLCTLDLCPVRIQNQREVHIGEQSSNVDMERHIKHEPRSDFAIMPFLDSYRPISQGAITSTCYQMKQEGYQPEIIAGRYENQQLSKMEEVGEKQTVNAYSQTMGLDMEPILKQGRNQVRYESSFFEDPPSSSPRDRIAEARITANVRGPRYKNPNRCPNSKQVPLLPQLTGDARARFKEQKQRIEQWQADNIIKQETQEMRRENNKAMKKERKRLQKQKKREGRVASTAAPEMKAEDDTHSVISSRTSKTSTRGKRQRGPIQNLLRSCRAATLFATDQANSGRTETFDPEAELYHPTFQPLTGFPDAATPLDVRDERETRHQSAENAMGMVHTMNEKRKKMWPLKSSKVQAKTYWQWQRQQELEQELALKRKEARDKEIVARRDSILVEYDLPDGEARLEWDTDFVRRVFGEIE